MDKPNIDYLRENVNRLGRLHIQKAFPEYFEYLEQKYQTGSKFSEKLYRDLIGGPKPCPLCGAEPKFIDFTNGFREYCSVRCSSLATHDKALQTRRSNYTNEEIIRKVKQTKLKRYGDVNYNNPEKSKQTCLGRYGVDSTLKVKSIRQKGKQTCLERYGDVNYNNREAARNTCLERYGVDNVSKLTIIQERKNKTFLDHYGKTNIFATDKFKMNNKLKFQSHVVDEHEFLIGYTPDGDWICKCPHPNCNKCQQKQYITQTQIYRSRLKTGGELCTNLLPIQSTPYSSMELFIRDILDDLEISYQTNDRTILQGQELDIYIPSLNIAIECNGCYWHQTNFHFKYSKPRQYHVDKYKRCLENGIRLITIWEDWYRHNPELIKSMLVTKLSHSTPSIYARKCQVKYITSRVANKFLAQNHIQGPCRSAVYIGLYKQDILVSVMSFGQRKGIVNRSSTGEWELTRFCSLMNVHIIGGASKLLKRFVKDYSPTTIVSFSSNDISDGNMYKVLGFEKVPGIQSSYWYIEHNTFVRYHRSSFTKQAIVKKYGSCDGTEYEVMDTKPYFRIYDTGTTKWIRNYN
jgi:hypothetical protein